MSQETLALGLVALAAISILAGIFRSYLAAPLARFFLRRGKIKLAMKIHSTEKTPGCDTCEPIVKKKPR